MSPHVLYRLMRTVQSCSDRQFDICDRYSEENRDDLALLWLNACNIRLTSWYPSEPPHFSAYLNSFRPSSCSRWIAAPYSCPCRVEDSRFKADLQMASKEFCGCMDSVAKMTRNQIAPEEEARARACATMHARRKRSLTSLRMTGKRNIREYRGQRSWKQTMLNHGGRCNFVRRSLE